MSTQETRRPATGTWSDAEDERLRAAVEKHGPRWILVAAEVGTRNGEQCAKRWNDYVNPDIDHSPWSTQEDQRLLPIVALCGHNWKHIAENFLPTRAPLSIKNRYALLMRRQKRQNVRLQRRNMDDAVFPTRNTALSHDHPPCSLDLVSVHSSKSPSFASGSERSQSHGAVDVSEPFTASTFPGALGQPFNSGGHGAEDAVPTGWEDEHSICNNLNLSSLFNIGADGRVDDEQQSGLPRSGGDSGLEFSVTCSRTMLRAMVCHAFDGAMSETAGMPEDEPVTVTLRLKN